MLELNKDTITQYRSIYSFFDFLGDVGGLLDLFLRFAQFLVTLTAWLVGNDLTLFLISSLFKSKGTKKPIGKPQQPKTDVDRIQQRGGIRIRWCNRLLRDKKS